MNKQDIPSDLQENLGELIFTPGQTVQTLQLELLADDIPEIEEVRMVNIYSEYHTLSERRDSQRDITRKCTNEAFIHPSKCGLIPVHNDLR